MGATSRTPQLELHLGTGPSDTIVWDLLGLNVFVDLEVATVATGIETTPICLSNVQGSLIVDIGDGCHEDLNDQSTEPTIILECGSAQFPPESGEVHQPVLHDGRHTLSGDDAANLTLSTGRENDKWYEKTAEVLTDKSGGTSKTGGEIAAKVPSEVEDTDIGGHSASMSFSKENAVGSAGHKENIIPVAAPTVLEMEGLDEDDMLAACQLLVLGHQGIREVVNKALAARQLLILSACVRTEEEKDFEGYCHEFHARSVSVKWSTPEYTICAGSPPCEACTTSVDQNVHQENDSWVGQGLRAQTSSDLRTLILKRIKPNKDPSGREYEMDDDWDILGRPPNKRQYKSLQQMYFPPPADS